MANAIERRRRGVGNAHSMRSRMALARAGKRNRQLQRIFPKKFNTTRKKIDAFNMDQAVRRTDTIDIEGSAIRKIRGRGQYKTWTSRTILRAALGRSVKGMLSETNKTTIRIRKRMPRLKSKLPVVFSLNSVAYWMGGSPDTVSKAQKSVANVYLTKQKDIVTQMLNHPQEFSSIGLHLEFDETGQKMQVRSDLCSTTTTMAVLVSRTTIFATKAGGRTTRLTIVNPPAVLRRKAAKSLWKGIVAKQPVEPFSLAASCDLTVATFVCDSATANQLMVTLVGQSSPANALVAGQEGTKSIIVRKWLSRSMFLDLLLHARSVLNARLVISYAP
ncbi:unnamed protein product [Durusdinium trenchii]|uniref:Capsid protein n=1 Tax=Durusdinium trenchii TaxID=1381693 RepID=A0ABP0NVX9_9DINO